MVYATKVRPAVFDSKKIKADSSGLLAFKNVELVEDEDLVAVVHLDPDIAYKAVKKIKVTWKTPEIEADNETIFQYMDDNIKKEKAFEENGNLTVGREASETIIEANYFDGYRANASIENHSATCYFRSKKKAVPEKAVKFVKVLSWI